LLFGIKVEAQRDKMLDEVGTTTSSRNNGDSTPEKQTNQTRAPRDREQPDKSDKPSFWSELKDSAGKAIIEADKCIEVAENFTDEPGDLVAVGLACWTKSVVEQTKKVVNGTTENCELPKDKNKYKKLPKAD
jgi:hypothetical protein